MSSQKNSSLPGFNEMTLSTSVLNALKTVGYDNPTPIQALTIPHLIQGMDVLAQARTGTGKTAAFALPLLSRIDLNNKSPQVLVLTPTRELAIQVGESFKTYGSGMKGLNVLSVYGGQHYGIQLNKLRQGVHVIVGTPGRLMDLINRKSISFTNLFCVVLDEADEMLRMGFIEDVEWILDKTPEKSQAALFSATMPNPIRKIAQKYLTAPKEILIGQDTTEIGTINQHYWIVKGTKKSDALIRILDATTFEGVIVFVKTKTATLELAKILQDNRFKAEALNGDIAQNAREMTVNRLKNGSIDVLVATDVAARGLDVERITHVINFDMPDKVDPYIHRIGRTGRAGRRGEAILFLNQREQWMIKNIEKATKQKIKAMPLPTSQAVNEKRIAAFKQTITQTLKSEDLSVFQNLIEALAKEKDIPVSAIAASLAKLAHGKTPFLLPVTKDRMDRPQKTTREKQIESSSPSIKKDRAVTKDQTATRKAKKNNLPASPMKTISIPAKMSLVPLEDDMERYRIEVGRTHGVRPLDIVGAISNEAGLESKYIGKINIDRDFSFVDLPTGMPKEIFRLLKKTWVRSRPMDISKCA